MPSSFVRQNADSSYALGNAAFELVVGLNAARVPVLRSLTSAKQPQVNWASPARPFGPELTIQGVSYSVAQGNVRFERFEAAPAGAGDSDLRIVYVLSNGLQVTQHLQPSPDKAVWRSWITLNNVSASPITGITRFDAANYVFSTGESQPQCGYVLGWLEGPRADGS